MSFWSLPVFVKRQNLAQFGSASGGDNCTYRVYVLKQIFVKLA